MAGLIGVDDVPARVIESTSELTSELTRDVPQKVGSTRGD